MSDVTSLAYHVTLISRHCSAVCGPCSLHWAVTEAWACSRSRVKFIVGPSRWILGALGQRHALNQSRPHTMQ